MLFAALLVQSNPAAAALHQIIADFHANDGTRAKLYDQGSVAQADDIGHSRLGAVFLSFHFLKLTRL